VTESDADGVEYSTRSAFRYIGKALKSSPTQHAIFFVYFPISFPKYTLSATTMITTSVLFSICFIVIIVLPVQLVFPVRVTSCLRSIFPGSAHCILTY